ncbi:hypothetical protein HID58_078537 [Brassica napus]|uniref:Uncharacterized protein n=1 Tax=Brassica napus TaxID=3708 RepID=A0ABQ7YUC8_BRANA|nr:hypothetical protein HID58_078537 [Brassica napus]
MKRREYVLTPKTPCIASVSVSFMRLRPSVMPLLDSLLFFCSCSVVGFSKGLPDCELPLVAESSDHRPGFDREHFFALLVSGDVDGAEEYLSVFTTQDSNYYSNLMFYFVKRQRFFKFLVEGENIKAGFLLIFSRPYGMMEMPIPETDEFISRDIQRIAHEGLKEWEDARDNGYTFDILSVAKSFTDEMFTMMNQLIPMNPDLHKKEEGEDISSQMHKLHLHDNQL